MKLVISGGQTGADIAGLRAAREVGIPTGGFAPRGWMTEKGPQRFKLQRIYGLIEYERSGYPARTKANVWLGDITLIIADNLDGGSRLTRDLCFSMKRPVFWVRPSDFNDQQSMKELVVWIIKRKHDRINIAGNRESKCPGLEVSAKTFLCALFRNVKWLDGNK